MIMMHQHLNETPSELKKSKKLHRYWNMMLITNNITNKISSTFPINAGTGVDFTSDAKVLRTFEAITIDRH